MANSQFTFYYSSDAGATGSYVINGQTGSLLNVLNKCLVEGYAGKPAAGWTKPFPDTASVGCFMQGSALDGANNACLHVHDGGPGAGVGIEARITGWDNIVSVFNGAVSGSGQFPLLYQIAIGSGALVVRKSINASALARPWIVAADSRSVYMFIQTGDSVGVYYSWMFGDIYSYKSPSVGIDTNRQVIIGRYSENTSDVNTYARLDKTSLIGTVNAGHFASRTFSGLGPSITLSKHGDWSKAAGSTGLVGIVPFPNGPDSATYLSRVWVGENLSSMLRGHMRGFWFWCHPAANATDLQPITGSGTLAGRTFLTIKSSEAAGVYVMETSNTIETN